MRRSSSIRTRITVGSSAVAIVIIVVAILGIRINAESTLHSSDVTLATTDLELSVKAGKGITLAGSEAELKQSGAEELVFSAQ